MCWRNDAWPRFNAAKRDIALQYARQASSLRIDSQGIQLMNRLRPTGTNPEHGFSLFEVLITVVVISIGLLGLAGLQFAGLRAANSAQDHTLATLLAQDIEERIRANALGAAGGAYNAVLIDGTSPYGTFVGCYTTSCPPGQIVNFDLNQWYRMLYPAPGSKPLLPNATINIIGNSTIFQVIIGWGDPSGPKTLNAQFGL